jgi:hypothetical protein
MHFFEPKPVLDLIGDVFLRPASELHFETERGWRMLVPRSFEI